jgi:DNA-binding LytR/AlgR family response regulator
MAQDEGRERREQAFLFDLDGTLVDSVYQHVLAWREALETAGIQLSVWRIHRRIGMSGGLFVRALTRAKDKLAHYAPRPQGAQRLAVRSRGQLLFLKVSEIDWIEAASYYACLHVGRETHILRRTLSELERDLGEGKLLRIHRSTIVNLDRIRGLELHRGGDYEVVLQSGVRLRLSRRFRKRLQDRMDAMASGA